MAYYSNASEGVWMDMLCEHCVHGVHQQPCPVMWLQLEWNYEQHPSLYEKRFDHASQMKAAAEAVKREALETLWPTGEDGWPDDCAMFVEYLDDSHEDTEAGSWREH